MSSKIKENDLFIFFEIIEQLEPKTVLDIGLLLKRAGSVSRKAMNREIPEKIRLDGVDFTPELCFPAMKNIYDEIMDIQTFLQRSYGPKYDCTIITGIKTHKTITLLPSLLQAVQKCSRYVLTDHNIEQWSEISQKLRHLRVNDDTYYLFDLGES